MNIFMDLGILVLAGIVVGQFGLWAAHYLGRITDEQYNALRLPLPRKKRGEL